MILLSERFDDQIEVAKMRRRTRGHHLLTPFRTDRRSSSHPGHEERMKRYAAIVARGGVLFEKEKS